MTALWLTDWRWVWLWQSTRDIRFVVDALSSLFCVSDIESCEQSAPHSALASLPLPKMSWLNSFWISGAANLWCTSYFAAFLKWRCSLSLDWKSWAIPFFIVVILCAFSWSLRDNSLSESTPLTLIFFMSFFCLWLSFLVAILSSNSLLVMQLLLVEAGPWAGGSASISPLTILFNMLSPAIIFLFGLYEY